jgi:signal transduction histidine kinase
LVYQSGGHKLSPTNIQEVMNSFRQIAESKEIKIKIIDFEKQGMVIADLTNLRSVLENLISNAIKFSTKKGNSFVNN